MSKSISKKNFCSHTRYYNIDLTVLVVSRNRLKLSFVYGKIFIRYMIKTLNSIGKWIENTVKLIQVLHYVLNVKYHIIFITVTK